MFRHFDRDLSNTLQEIEFSAALASLGLVYDEEEMHKVFESVSSGGKSVSFEQFIRFMVEETEDQNSAEQVYQSFKEVADGNPAPSARLFSRCGDPGVFCVRQERGASSELFV